MRRTSVAHEYYIIHEAATTPEVTGRNLKILRENKFNNTKLTTVTFEVVLQSCTTKQQAYKNWNGREYYLDDVLKALNNNAIIQYDIKMGTWTAEYGHPKITKNEDMIARQMTIEPDRACDRINKYWTEGGLIIGECTTLADGMGEMVKNRILTEYPVMKSSRAIGAVDAQGRVLPGYTIRTFDTVITPSHKESYQTDKQIILNDFNPPSGQTFNESLTKLNPATDVSFKNFILTEASSKIELLCNTLELDYNSLNVDSNNITIKKINESSTDTLIIPIRKVIASEYHRLF